MAKVPEEIRNLPRPPSTVVIHRSSGVYAVKERHYEVDEKGRHCVDGPILGHFINGEFVPVNGIPNTGSRVDSKEWANVALCDKSFRDVLRHLCRYYNTKEATWIYVMAIIRGAYPGVRDYQVDRRYRESYLSEMYPGLGMSKNTVCSKLRAIGGESNRIRDFMRDRVGELKVDEMVVIDGSLTQDESDVNTLSKRSRKYNEVKHRQYLKMYAYGADRLEPVCSKIYPGNMTDSRAVGDFIRTFQITKGIIVADKGFPGVNVREAIGDAEDIHYLLPLKDNMTDIAKHAMLDFDDLVPGTTVQCKKVYADGGRWLYSFRDPDLAMEEECEFLRRHADGYDPEVLKDLRAGFGTIVFESDLDLECSRVRAMYEDRWLIELFFKFYSSQLDFDDTREHSDYSVVASNFIDFLSVLLGTRLVALFDKVDSMETWSYSYILDFLRCKKMCRVEGDTWENERYTKEDTEILVELGLLDMPVIPMEPKRKAGRPKGSKDRKPRKPRSKKGPVAVDTATSNQPASA